MINYDNLEEFRDAETYDVVCDAYDEDFPFLDEWAQSRGGPFLDLACGTGRMALRLAGQGYQVTGVDVVPEMIARARLKAMERALSVEWVVADGRHFQLHKQFPAVYMLMNAFQFFLTRQDQEAMLMCVREHLQPDGEFLFETRNPSPRNLLEVRHPEPQHYTMPDGAQLVVTEAQYYDPMTQIQHYTCPHQWTNPDGQRRERTHHTALRYVFPQEMEALLFYNGFEIIACYGNWAREPLIATSPAMIYRCRKRQ
jgi:SAM-dependent methyltransferase